MVPAAAGTEFLEFLEATGGSMSLYHYIPKLNMDINETGRHPHEESALTTTLFSLMVRNSPKNIEKHRKKTKKTEGTLWMRRK